MMHDAATEYFSAINSLANNPLSLSLCSKQMQSITETFPQTLFTLSLRYSPSFYPRHPLCYEALPGAAGDVYVSDPWCLASKQTLAWAPVPEGLHVSALALLCICITTEPQLANQSQALTAHSLLAHKPWSVLRSTTVDMPQ